MTLKVVKDGIVIKWLLMEESSVINGGFGIFALRPFKKLELITVYLGEEIGKEYSFGNVIGIPPTQIMVCSPFQQ
jgi:hypothetical protein